MKIAVIGTGSVGSTLGRRWAALDHDVTFGSRRPDDPEVRTLASEAGASAAPPAEAARRAEVVVLAVPWKGAERAVVSLGDLSGKILVDCTNAVGPGFTVAEDARPSGAERIAAWAGGARVVKAFSTTGAENMADPVYPDGPLPMLLCGDDERARRTVAGLAEELGFEAVDLGPLARARLLEPLAIVWIALAHDRGWGRRFGIALPRR